METGDKELVPFTLCAFDFAGIYREIYFHKYQSS